MGTFFTTGATKTDIIEEIKADYRDRVLDSHVKGNEFWAAIRCQDTVIIALFLLVADSSGWGYKPMDETAGPYYYGCPVGWFAKYPTTNETALAWRQSVRHKRK